MLPYTDTETSFVLMGHRYYDPAEGRFVTRDPMSYGGGINLYGFAGNDPVNGSDASGLRPLTESDRVRLLKLGRAARNSYQAQGRLPQASTVNRAVADIMTAIAAVPTGSSDPANLKAVFWAIDELGDSKFGKAGSVGNSLLGSGISPIGSGYFKCNLFAYSAYAVGADLGWNAGKGVPATHRYSFSKYSAPSANMLGNSGIAIHNFDIVSNPEVGDIAGFPNAHGGEGHASIYVGGGPYGLVIYAGPNFVKAQSILYVMTAGDEYPLFRQYEP